MPLPVWLETNKSLAGLSALSCSALAGQAFTQLRHMVQRSAFTIRLPKGLASAGKSEAMLRSAAILNSCGRRRMTSRVLPRSADEPAPSFDALVASVSRDVRPKAVLDELLRLGVVHDERNRMWVVTRHADVLDALFEIGFYVFFQHGYPHKMQ